MNWYKKATTDNVRQYQFDSQDNVFYKILEREQPFQENDVIKVYHGFRSAQDAYLTIFYGLSGQEQIGRTYSYESNNNPKGLFITLDIETAKEFTSQGYIMEFNAKYSDLESPVWPGGGYTTQGEMSQSWSWEKLEEQREEGRLKQREEAEKSEYEAIRNSDRPELAESLMSPREYQALFVGNLSPADIQAIWVPIIDEDGYRKVTDKWERLTVEDFKTKYEEDINKMQEEKSERYQDLKNRVFTPVEDFEAQTFLSRLYGGEKTLELIKRWDKEDAKKYLKEYIWPKQYADMEQWVESL